MKLAVLLQFSSDRKAGSVIAGPIPYDEALAEHKRRVRENDFDPNFPRVEIWTARGGTAKKRRFDPASHVPAPAPVAEESYAPNIDGGLPPISPAKAKRARPGAVVLEDDGNPD